MNNRTLIKRILALFLALTLCTCCLTSCSFDINDYMPEKVEATEPKELIGASDLNESEMNNVDMITERVEDFYRNVSNMNYDFIRMDFVPLIRGGFQIVYYGAVIVFEHDLLEILAPTATKGVLGYGFSLLYEDYEEVSCASIVVSGDNADVVIRLVSHNGTVKYHKTKLAFHEEDWFLSSFPVTTNWSE